MSYVIFLGFKCTVYKKPPTVRVSLNDIFLDEFVVVPDKSCDVNNYNFFSNKLKEKTFPRRISPANKFLHRIEQFTEKENNFINRDIIFKIIEFDRLNLEQTNTLKIDILNSDNNYTNGFMTKSTLISLYVVQLLPKKALISPLEFYNKFLDDRNKLKKTHIDVYSLKKSYQNKIQMYDIYNYNLQKSDSSKSIFCIPYYNRYSNKIENLKHLQWIGTSGFFQFKMPKYLLTPDIPVEIADIDDLSLYCLANKYKQYANL